MNWAFHNPPQPRYTHCMRVCFSVCARCLSPFPYSAWEWEHLSAVCTLCMHEHEPVCSDSSGLTEHKWSVSPRLQTTAFPLNTYYVCVCLCESKSQMKGKKNFTNGYIYIYIRVVWWPSIPGLLIPQIHHQSSVWLTWSLPNRMQKYNANIN